MTGIFIAYNQAYYEEVIELLEQHHTKGFTRWNEISGRGSYLRKRFSKECKPEDSREPAEALLGFVSLFS